MKLSIVIVNYNVRYFLSNCLQSVIRATEGMDAEVFVVDNDSTDQSVEMVRADFPSVKVIANHFNAGFSKANNQAIEQVQGEYILLLNPDTVVEEDCFRKCCAYMDEHNDAGGMGVKMIDGAGKFLPESKRGLPTPAVAFYKIFGLSRLFPKSKRFGAYHLGYLDENEIAEVDVLSGAFMLMRKTVIDKIGGLDEAFFMYGEDIDMSYRITQAGSKNIYFPKSRIIHFKGESTKKSSVNYVLVFYRAMIIFAKKHFSYKNASILSVLINLAIYLRASVALINRFFTRIYMPFLDFILLGSSLILFKEIYERLILKQDGYFPQEVEIMAFPILIVSWIFSQFLLGGYHQPVKLKAIFKGLITSSLLILILYAMLDESMRFSRAIVAISVIASFLIIPLSRIVMSALGFFRLIRFTESNTAIVGSESEIKRVSQILSRSSERRKRLFFINPLKKSANNDLTSSDFVGSFHQLKDAVDIFDIDELIFCLKDIQAKDLIDVMQTPSVQKSSIYLHPPMGNYLLRSSSINSLGEFIIPETNPIMSPWSIRKKRIFEVFFSLAVILLSPFMVFFYRRPNQLIKNMFGVLLKNCSLVGYSDGEISRPYIVDAFTNQGHEEEYNQLIVDYLMNYGTEKDLEIVLSRINQLDRIPLTG